MNTIDLIVCLVLLLAVWNGWRQGFILQVCSLAGIVAGIWLASRYGAAAGELLRLDPEIAAPAGFVTVLLVVVLVVAILARVARKVFHFAGFGIPDVILGILVAVVKFLLILSALFSALERLNDDYSLVDKQTIEESKTYKPILRLSQSVLPLFEWVGDRIPERTEEQPH